MSEQKNKDYRQQFINQGYAIVENVLTAEEASGRRFEPLCFLTKSDLNLQNLMPGI